MRIGDLVVQIGWEEAAVGIVTRILKPSRLDARATVQWPCGEADMYQSQLKVVSASR